MKRYYSHYTFIYPDIFLKNYIVELNDVNELSAVFGFEKEIEKTEFHSGWLYFLPPSIKCITAYIVTSNNEPAHFTDPVPEIAKNSLFAVYNGSGICLST